MNTTTTTTVAAPTSRQRELIADLAAELGRDLELPAARKAASALIARAVTERTAAQGDKPAPTARQLRLLEKLGQQRGRTYQLPATRKQASARIAQILAAGPPEAREAAAV